MKIISLAILLFSFSAISFAKTTTKFKYMDYQKNVYEGTFVQDGDKSSVKLDDYNYTVPLKSQTEEGQTVFVSDVLKDRVQSKSASSMALHSVMVLPNSKKSADDLRGNLDELKKAGNITSSGPEICPKEADGVLVLAIRDLGPIGLCIVSEKSLADKVKGLLKKDEDCEK